MREIVGAAFLSLDGVMQAPGGPTEDPTGAFLHGGWLPPHADEVSGNAVAALFDRPFDLLLGRRTYDIFAAFWPYVAENAIGTSFQQARKYVLTRGDRPLSWRNSERATDIDAVAALKESDGPRLLIQGSSSLYPQLLAAGLIDRLTLMTFPVVLGRGKRLFGDGTTGTTMRMVEHAISERGTIVATYEPAGPVNVGTFPSPEPSEAELARRKAMADGSW